jgi:hypothetical protein
VITKGGGQDTIGDFQPGVDKVLFKGFSAAEIRSALAGQGASLAPLSLDHHHAQAGTQLDLGLGHADTLDLVGVAHLDPYDIVIG